MVVQLKEYQMLFVRIPREIEVFYVVFFLIVKASRNDEDFFFFLFLFLFLFLSVLFLSLGKSSSDENDDDCLLHH